MGISFPTQHAAWLELVLISMITPNASFLGHLAGILAGFLYMHGLVHAITFLPRHVLRVLRLLFIGGPAPDNSQTRYTYTSGFARTDATQSQRVDDEVEIELEYEEDFQPSQREEYPDSLDLRQQRLRRFNQQQQQASQRTTQSSTSRR